MRADLKAVIDAVRAIPFHTITSQHELDAIFVDLAAVHGDAELRGLALERLGKALWIDAEVTRKSGEGRDLAARMAPFFATVAAEGNAIDSVRGLAHELEMSWERPEVRAVVARWCEALRAADFPPTELDALELRFVDRADPTLAPRLLALLDAPDDWLRSCAAMMLGEQYARADADLAPIEAVLRDLAGREVMRAGVAGPFLSSIVYEGLLDRAELQAWLLDILRSRPGLEPALPTNGIDFYAHELLSDSAEHVLALVALGRADIAIAAATEDPHFLMRPALDALADHADPNIAGPAQRMLAVYHRTRHPRPVLDLACGESGAIEWFVELVKDGARRRPWWIAIYPRTGTLASAEIERLVDRVFPAAIRGEHRATRPFTVGQDDWYPRGERSEYAHGFTERWFAEEDGVALLHLRFHGEAWDAVELLRAEVGPG